MQAFRSKLLHFKEDPRIAGEDAVEFFEDGMLVVKDGHVVQAGDAAAVRKTFPNVPVTGYPGKLIMPGFIDAHVHFPQNDMIASYADGLLPWLEKHTFPAEARFKDEAYAAEVSAFFLDELLRNGTTTAMVFGTVHRSAVDAFFEQAQRRNMRMIAGKVLMDRHCPGDLRDSAEEGARDTEALIRRWHEQDRLSVAITPRFAPTSTDAQLTLAGEIASAHPDVFIQTHVAENKDEMAWVKELYPHHRSYLDVYARHGLLRKRAMYAHGIYLDDTDRDAVAQAGAAIAVCPTSNLFLGSGLFDFGTAWGAGVATPLATDVGAGTSYSMLRTMQAAHFVARLNRNTVSPFDLFYWPTLGAARVLGWADRIGSFRAGSEADFIVLDPAATPLMARRSACAASLQDLLFALAILGDDRAVAATYILGRPAYLRD